MFVLYVMFWRLFKWCVLGMYYSALLSSIHSVRAALKWQLRRYSGLLGWQIVCCKWVCQIVNNDCPNLLRIKVVYYNRQISYLCKYTYMFDWHLAVSVSWYTVQCSARYSAVLTKFKQTATRWKLFLRWMLYRNYWR